jgi:hypothetical protein
MATENTLTGIIPVIYEALNVVSREMIGLIPAVTSDSTAARAAVGQTVRSPVGEAGELEDVTPGQLPANTGGTTVGYKDVVITNSKAAPVLWSGEEQLSVGGSYNPILLNQFTDGFRKLANAIEADLALTGITHASRAYGTPGTAPFGTAGDLSDTANVLKILEDNGAPKSDLQLALNSGAMLNLRGKQSVLFKVNEAGSSDMLRNGMTDRLQGFALRNSAGFAAHTKGTGAGFVLNGAAAAGATTIAVDTGTGTILPGDVITIGDDTNKYVVTAALAGGNVTIAKPGLRAAAADGATVTVGNNYAGNLGFARSAIILAARAPALPDGGDMADDRTMVQDPFSGLSFEVSLYRMYRQVKYEIAMAWGTASVKDEHIALLLG